MTKTLILTVCILLNSYFSSTKSFAQIIPDKTLGDENSTINSVDSLRNLIEGGAIRGENLFHSFQEFNVEEGSSVNFINPEGISRIFSRVTGNNISEIFGNLGVGGNADLLFINPNGILFGENASVNVNGSLIFSTANDIDFTNDSEFSATNPDSSLLTISTPVGLGFGNIPGDIEVRGNGHPIDLRINSPSERVPIPIDSNQQFSISSEQNIALIGSNVLLNGGIINTNAGSIEIAGVSGGSITFDQSNWNFVYNNINSFGDITLNSRALLNASGNFSGSIGIAGNNVVLSDSSLVEIQNRNSTAASSINVKSSNLQLIGEPFNPAQNQDDINLSPPAIISESVSGGASANISINTEELSLENGGIIASANFDGISGGNISVNALDSVRISGFANPISTSLIGTSTYGESNSGNIEINTPQILLESGGIVSTSSFNSGNAGNLNINISESTDISGFQDITFGPSTISSVTFEEGNSGNITVNTSKLNLSNTGNITSLSLASGNAGEVQINASEMILLEDRISEEPILASAIASSAEIVFDATVSLFGLDTIPTGNAGTLTINTPRLSILDGGIIAVRSTGTGSGGELNINADKIFLDNRGEISASTSSGEGGNLNLNTNNLELLDQSQITTNAGGVSNGGNINIDSNSILGIENSDITANAIGGSGGNITINTDAILGLEERSQLTSFGDITASSEFGIDGTVNVNSPDNNAERDVFSAFRTYASPKTRALVKSRCLNPRNSKGKLLYVGRSGIPENPNNFFDDEEIAIVDSVIQPKQSSLNPDESQVWIEGDPIIDSNSIKIGKDGEIFLVAETNLENASSNICSNKK